ncbi:MAG: hypothetical protein FWF59_03815 [Turicibacter sp.]|nr:hypothetical protein [Turicibacter sp.]
MNHLLFRVAEVEERLLGMTDSPCGDERQEANRQLLVLDRYKYRPVRSYEESQGILWEFNSIFS